MLNRTLNKRSCFFLAFFSALVFMRLPAQSVGGQTSGAASFCDSINSGFISLSGFQGQILFWEFSVNNGNSWTQIQNPTSTQSYVSLKQTTSFRAIVKDGNFPSDTSSISTITIHIPGIAGNISGGGVFCASSGAGTIQVSDAPGTVLFWQSSVNNGASWVNVQNQQFSLAYSQVTINTLYRAVVETVQGCPADTSGIASFTINQFSEAGTVFGADSLCPNSPGDTLTVSNYTGAIQGWLVSEDVGTTWNPVNGNNAFLVFPKVTRTRLYSVMVKNGVCLTDTSQAAAIVMYDQVPANAGPDLSITRFESVQLQASGDGTPEWKSKDSLSDPRIINPTVQPLNDARYYLKLTDVYGCVSEDSVDVLVNVPIPTAITPNNDGVNDVFFIHEIEKYPNNSLQVFDRWGLLVYEASPYKNDWNGKSAQGIELADGFYAYVFDFGTGEKAATNYILIKR